MATSPQFAATVNEGEATFANADGTNVKTIFTAGANGSMVENISITTNDTTSRIVVLQETIGANTRTIGRIVLPAATASVPIQMVNGLDPDVLTWLNPADPVKRMKASALLKAYMEVAVTSAKFVDIVVTGGDL